MNRVALGTVLAIAAIVGIVFGVYPKLDIDISKLFFDPHLKVFPASAKPWEQMSRDAARWLITLLVLPSFIAIAGKLFLPTRRMLVNGSTAVFLTLTLAIGPGLVTNVILKDHWARARPIDVMSFGADGRFTPWWDPTGSCDNNCSFVAGEPSGAFWTVAVATIAPMQWRVLAYAAAIVFGTAIGVLRIAAGAHFFTDVVFAGVITYLVVWVMHGLIFRWQPTRLDRQTIECRLARCGKAIRGALTALRRRPS